LRKKTFRKYGETGDLILLERSERRGTEEVEEGAPESGFLKRKATDRDKK